MSKFPKFGLIDVLLILAKIGYGKDKRMESAWNVLDRHKTEEMKYKLDSDRKSKYWKFGKRGKANKWITFYAYLCLKHKKKKI